MKMERPSHCCRAIAVLLMLGGMVISGCATFTQEAEFAKAYPSGPQKVVDKAAVRVQVEDMIEDAAFIQDATFLGEDVYDRNLVYLVIPMGKDYRYVADQPRTDLVRYVLRERFDAAGVPLGDQSGRAFSQGGGEALSLSVRVKKLAFSTVFSSVVPLLVVNFFNYHDEQVDAVLEIQVTQAGSTKPLWQGTVTGKAEGEELEKMEHTARANIKDRRAWMIHEAIDRATQTFMTTSQIVQISARLRNDAYANALKPAQEAEARGNLQAALTHYGRAYQAADTDVRSFEVIKAVAQVAKKLNGQLALPEDARRFGVQAGTLAQQKKYDAAVALYQQALEVAPWWPEAHFNRALLLAEVSHYSEAMVEMKQFLTLSPNASDARGAQDKIYEWELKAK